MTHEIPPQRALRLVDALVGGQFDQIRRLVLVEVVALDKPELDRSGDDPLLEVLGVEGEPVAEELDDVVISGLVVHIAHHVFGAYAAGLPSAPLRTVSCPCPDAGTSRRLRSPKRS